MITTIVNENNTIANPFPGMSLAEACAHVHYETAQIMNECQMNILLSEHAYLYENGVEMQYVDEAGQDNENGLRLKERLLGALETANKTVQELWDKLMEFIASRVDGIIEYMTKMGVSQKAFDKAKDIFLQATTSEGGMKIKLPKVVDFGKFESEFASLYNEDGFSNTENKVWENYVDPNGGEVNMTNEAITKAANFLFNKNDILKSIRTKKKESNRYIESIKKKVKSAKTDNMKDTLDNLNAAIKTNSAIARDSSKVYHAHLANCVQIVREVLRHPEVRKAARDGFKASVKAAPGKVANAAKEAPGKVVDAAKAAPGKAADMADKAKSKFFPTGK